MSKKKGKASGQLQTKQQAKGKSSTLKKTILGVTTAAIAAGAGGGAAQAGNSYTWDALQCAGGGVKKVIGGTTSTTMGALTLAKGLLTLNGDDVKKGKNSFTAGMTDIMKGATKTVIGTVAAPLGLAGDTGKWAYHNPGKTAYIVGVATVAYLGYQHMLYKNAQFDAQLPEGAEGPTLNTQSFFGDHLKPQAEAAYDAVYKTISSTATNLTSNAHGLFDYAKNLVSENAHKLQTYGQSWVDTVNPAKGAAAHVGGAPAPEGSSSWLEYFKGKPGVSHAAPDGFSSWQDYFNSGKNAAVHVKENLGNFLNKLTESQNRGSTALATVQNTAQPNIVHVDPSGARELLFNTISKTVDNSKALMHYVGGDQGTGNAFTGVVSKGFDFAADDARKAVGSSASNALWSSTGTAGSLVQQAVSMGNTVVNQCFNTFKNVFWGGGR